MKDRRQSTEFDCRFDGKRKTDKAASFILFILLVFLLNFLFGCVSQEVVRADDPNLGKRSAACVVPLGETECEKAWFPEPEVELDSFLEVEE